MEGKKVQPMPNRSFRIGKGKGIKRKQMFKENKQKLANVGENMKELELLCTVSGSLRWYSHCGK